MGCRGGRCEDERHHELSRLNGPHHLRDVYPTKLSYLNELFYRRQTGSHVIFIEQLARRLSSTGTETGLNFVVPVLVPRSRENSEDAYLTDVVVVANPKDAQRVARLHITRSIYQFVTFSQGESVFGARDLDLWREQRKTLAESFLPLSTLAKVMPVSLALAESVSLAKISKFCEEGKPFDAYEFFHHETASQLHVVMFGETREFSDEYIKRFGPAYDTIISGRHLSSPEKFFEAVMTLQEFAAQLVKRSVGERGEPLRAGPFRALARGCPVVGPLAATMIENVPSQSAVVDPLAVQQETVLNLAIAGFDTTSNLLTWFAFEMARKPHLQRRLHEEIDRVLDEELQGRELTYDDLGRFKFLTRCINEALRVWNSAPIGTFRELQFSETIEGMREGETVHLKAGTEVWIPTWLLHRSEAMWGSDVLTFNPDREWLPEESFYGRDFGAVNPASPRFCPFGFPPRSCLGFNFTQMESRVLITTIYRDFSFELAEPTATAAHDAEVPDYDKFLGLDRATMAPKGGMWVVAKRREHSAARRRANEAKMRVGASKM